MNYPLAMKFAVRFSLSLTLVMLLAMVGAEPKTYLVETGGGTGGQGGDGRNDDGGSESLRLEVRLIET